MSKDRVTPSVDRSRRKEIFVEKGIYERLIESKEHVAQAVRVKVPVAYLSGTQTPAGYTSSSISKIQKFYRQHPAVIDEDLSRYPLALSALTYNSGISLTILDGHTRARYCPQERKCGLESLVFAPETVAHFITQFTGIYMDPQMYIEFLHASSLEVMREFEMYMGAKYEAPLHMTGVHNILEIPSLFDRGFSPVSRNGGRRS